MERTDCRLSPVCEVDEDEDEEEAEAADDDVRDVPQRPVLAHTQSPALRVDAYGRGVLVARQTGKEISVIVLEQLKKLYEFECWTLKTWLRAWR